MLTQTVYEGDVPLQPADFVPGTANLISRLMELGEGANHRTDVVLGVPASFPIPRDRAVRLYGPTMSLVVLRSLAPKHAPCPSRGRAQNITAFLIWPPALDTRVGSANTGIRWRVGPDLQGKSDHRDCGYRAPHPQRDTSSLVAHLRRFYLSNH